MKKWSLSEFLNLLELRSQYCCFVELNEDSGFSIAHNENINFYAVMEGTVYVYGSHGEVSSVSAGDIFVVLSGEGHAIRTQTAATTSSLEYLEEWQPVDVPTLYSLGGGNLQARLLCLKLKVRWPFGQKPKVIPPTFTVSSTDSPINLVNLERLTSIGGGASVLTRAASLIVTMAFQNQSESEQMFMDFVSSNPVDCVKQYIEKHPFSEWTVEILARKVGMGRSTLAARFTSETGITPMEYVTKERMKLAEKLLLESDLKISDISQRVGYRSEAAFSRRITLHFGMSPGKMRKNSRRTHKNDITQQLTLDPNSTKSAIPTHKLNHQGRLR